jgi:hypothetical protein
VTLMFRLLPKIGPLRPLAFETPTPEAERLFAESFTAARTRYRAMLAALAAGRRLDLPNTDFDTGTRSRFGEYPLADDTYAEILDTYASRRFAGMPVPLRHAIEQFYVGLDPLTITGRKERKRVRKVVEQLEALRAVPATPGARPRRSTRELP